MSTGVEAARNLMHFAVGAFNVDNQETLLAIARAAQGKNAPVLVEVSHGEVDTEDIDYDEIRKTFSTPEGARAFVQETGIDTFAAAVGNLHGRYPVPKQLDLELLQRIRDALDINISLYGGSGTPGHFFQSAAQIGVSKININSDLRYAYRTTLEAQLAAHPDEYALVKLIDPVITAVQDVVEERIDLFGSTGKAQPRPRSGIPLPADPVAVGAERG